MTNSTVRKIQTSTSSGVHQSPVLSASERFQSPVAGNVVKKKLFTIDSSKVKPGQSVLNKTMAIVVDDKGNQRYIPLTDVQEVAITQPPTVTPKPKRHGSLALFFRKVSLTIYFVVT